MPFVTVFTPTYNRGYILPKLYDSLRSQTSSDFEWIIVDDGSNDDTEKLIAGWLSEKNKFEIVYIKQENAGKMQAVNKGVTYAKGKMFFIVDSDDCLPENSIERIIYWESTIKDKSDFVGVAGCRYFKDGNLIGSSFAGQYLDATSLEKKQNGIVGDKAEVFYTNIIKKYPFPHFEGEKFVPEALIYNRIANDGYKFRWVNENFYICEYLPDGYTKNIHQNLVKNWRGYSLYVKELMNSKVSFREKFVPMCGYAIHFIMRIFIK